MSYIDQKYINLCTSRVEKFKKVRDNLWNFRCPICGDSHKRKDKARRITEGGEAEMDAVIERQGEFIENDLVDLDPGDFAKGGIARMLGE